MLVTSFIVLQHLYCILLFSKILRAHSTNPTLILIHQDHYKGRDSIWNGVRKWICGTLPWGEWGTLRGKKRGHGHGNSRVVAETTCNGKIERSAADAA